MESQIHKLNSVYIILLFLGLLSVTGIPLDKFHSRDNIGSSKPYEDQRRHVVKSRDVGSEILTKDDSDMDLFNYEESYGVNYESMVEDSTGMLGDSTGMLGDSTGMLGDSTGMLGDSTGMLGDSTGMLGDITGMLGDSIGMSRDSTGMLRDSTSMHGDSTDMHGDSTGMLGDSTDMRGDSTGMLGDSTGMLGDSTDMRGDSTGMLGDSTDMLGDSTSMLGESNGVYVVGSVGSDMSSSIELESHRRRHGHSDRRVKMSCEPTPPTRLREMMGPSFNARYMAIERPYTRLFGDQADVFDERELLDQPDDSADIDHGDFAVEKTFSRILPDEKESRMDFDSAIQDEDLGIEIILRKLKKPSTEPIQHAKVKRDTLDAYKRKSENIRKEKRVSRRSRRALLDKEIKLPWQCSSKIIWKDLGDNHFPRFIRAASCTQKRCVHNFHCAERAFTIKVLRRVSDECVPVPSVGQIQRNSDGSVVIVPGKDSPPRYEQEWVFEEMAVPFCCECRRTPNTPNLSYSNPLF